MSRSQRATAPRRISVPLVGALLFTVILPEMAVRAEGLKVHNTYGSPLDTLRNTHLTTTVPEAKDFVRSTTPDKDKLDYTPLTGQDPDRPKLRDSKGVAALQAELEGAGVKNEAKAKGMLPRKAGPRKGLGARTSSVTAATR